MANIGYNISNSSNSFGTISTSNSLITGTNNISIGNKYAYNTYYKYNILGTVIELESSTDLSIIISLINTLGFQFYDNLKNTDINLPSELEKLMEDKRIPYNREKNIDNILK